MNTSPQNILLPLLIALGSTGIAGTAIAEDNPHNLLPLPQPLQTTADAEQPETPRFRVLTTIDFTNLDLYGFPLAAPQELLAPQESTTAEADQPSEQTIVADGSEQRLNLSGQPGRNATEAGVRGRNGEPGGDGRNLTIYYTDPEHLRNIYVNAAGGPGGAGAPSSTERVCSTSESSSNPHHFPSPLPANPPVTRESSPTPIESLIRPAPGNRPNLPPELQEHLRDQLKEEPSGTGQRGRRRGRRRGGQRGDGERQERGRGRRGGEGRQERRGGEGRRGGGRPQRPPRLPAPSLPAPSVPDNVIEPRVDTPAPTPRPAVPQCYTTTIPAGSSGPDGQPGQLTLINASDPLPPEQPAVTVPLADLSDRTFELAKHLWETRTGAAAWLAPGSTVADEYLEFVSRLEETVRVQWQASPNPVQSQVDQVVISLNQQGDVELDFGSEVWVDHTSQRQESGLEIAIAALVPVDEVTDLALGRVVPGDNTLDLQVIDRAGHADTLATTFHIHYRSAPAGALHEPRPRWQTRYEGEIPAELVTRDHNRFVIDLSQLPIEAQYQRSGTPVNIEITATRSLGDRAKTQTLHWQDQLR